MSDDSYEQEWGSGSDSDANKPGEDPDTDTEIENNFYEAEDEMKHSPVDALSKFEDGVVLMEENRPEKKHSFKAIQNIVIITAQLSQFDKMQSYTGKMLKMTGQQSANEVSEAVTKILETV